MFDQATFTSIIHDWLAGAGDEYLSSTINTILYLVASAAAFYRWRVLSQERLSRPERVFWLSIALMLLFLGINKELDFQVLLREVGRRAAESDGWYQYRRLVQAVFAAILTAAITLYALFMIYLIRKSASRYLPALLGLLILCGYVILETTSLSHVGLNLAESERWGVRLTDLIEMAGIALIFVSARIGIRNAVRFN